MQEQNTMKLFERAIWVMLTLAMSMPSLAQTVSREEALTRGAAFLSKNLNLRESHRAGSRDGSGQDYQISLSTEIVRSDSVHLLGEAFYVVQPHEAEGFVIVAGDDRMAPVLAYSDHSGFSTGDMPDVVREWLEGYAREYAALPSTATSASDDSTTNDYITENEKKRNWLPIKEGGVSPLLGDRDWGQKAPYNWMTPLSAGTNYHCLTGCVATAIAQVMAYHKWPAQGQGTHTYTTSGVDGEITVDFSQSFYDWDHMRDVYKPGQYTTEEGNAVALLMRDCGVAMDMQYGTKESGSWTPEIPHLIPEHFDYTTDMVFICDLDVWGDHATWQRIALRELNNNRPIIYAGDAIGRGHCFVIDGYQVKSTSDWPYYHVNWGWPAANSSEGYDYRGYYLLTSLQPEAYRYGEVHTMNSTFTDCEMIVNFRPNRNLDDEPLLLAIYDYTYTPQPNHEYRMIGREKESEWYYSYDIMLRKLVGRDYHGTVSLRAVNSKGVSRELHQEEVTVVRKTSHIKNEYLELPADLEPDVYTMEWYIREQGSERDSMLYGVSNCHLVICDQTPQLTAQVASTSSEVIKADGYSITIEVANQSLSPFYGSIYGAFLQPEKALQDTIVSDYVSIPAGETRQVTMSGDFCYLAPVQTEIRFLNGYDMTEIPSSEGGNTLTYSAMFEPYIPVLKARSTSVTSGTCDTDFTISCNRITNTGKLTFAGDFRLMLRDHYGNNICPIGEVYTIPLDLCHELKPDIWSSYVDVSIVATLPETVPNGDYQIILEAKQTNAEQWTIVMNTHLNIRVIDEYLKFFDYSNNIENYFFTIPRPYYCGTPSFYNIVFATEGNGKIWNDGKSVYRAILVSRGGSAEISFEPYSTDHVCTVSQGDRDLTSRLVNNCLKFENVMENIQLQVVFGQLRSDLNHDKKISIGDLANLVDPTFDTDDYTQVDLNYNGRIDRQDYQILAEKIGGDFTYQGAASKVMGDDAPYHEGYTFVNMGLPEPYDKLLWATCNVGAKYPYETGDYFAWGETSYKYDYSQNEYTFYDEDCEYTYNKYQGSKDEEDESLEEYFLDLDGLTELTEEDDAARVERGGNWRIPCRREWNALIDNCTITMFKEGHPHYKGVAGIEFTGPNGNKLFLPQTGYRYSTSKQWTTRGCYYWSRDMCPMYWRYYDENDQEVVEWDANFASSYVHSMWSQTKMYHELNSRVTGMAIRPVIDNEVELPEEGPIEIIW